MAIELWKTQFSSLGWVSNKIGILILAAYNGLTGGLRGYRININKHFQKFFTTEFSVKKNICHFMWIGLEKSQFHLAAAVMTLFLILSAYFIEKREGFFRSLIQWILE